jgi:hypothetical protein
LVGLSTAAAAVAAAGGGSDQGEGGKRVRGGSVVGVGVVGLEGRGVGWGGGEYELTLGRVDSCKGKEAESETESEQQV